MTVGAYTRKLHLKPVGEVHKRKRRACLQETRNTYRRQSGWIVGLYLLHLCNILDLQPRLDMMVVAHGLSDLKNQAGGEGTILLPRRSSNHRTT